MIRPSGENVPKNSAENEKSPAEFDQDHLIADSIRSASWMCGVVALLVFAITLRNDFIYDDIGRILEDPRVQSPAQIWKLLTGEYNNGGQDNLWRPVVSLTYAVQYWMHQGLGWPYHAVNILLHAGVTVMVARLSGRVGQLALRLSSESPSNTGAYVSFAAILGGMLFAVHPIHAEAVSAIVGRAELMCAAGLLGAVLLMWPVVMEKKMLSVGKAAAVLGCVCLSLLSKEMGVICAPVLLAMVLLRGHEGLWGIWTVVKRRKLSPSWAVLVLGICFMFSAYIVLRENVLGLKFWWDRNELDWSMNPLVRAEGYDRWLIPMEIAGRYAKLLVWPDVLAIDYGLSVVQPSVRGSMGFVVLGVATAAVWLGLMLWSLFHLSSPFWRAGAWLTLSCGFAYALISNLFTIIGTTMGERLMYVPSVFLCLGVAVIVVCWLGRLDRLPLGATNLARVYQYATTTLFALVLLASGWRSFDYVSRWNDRATFYEYQHAVQPNSVRIALALAVDHWQQGRLKRAEEVAQAARNITPTYFEVWVMSSVVATDLGKHDEAVEFAQQAVKLWTSMHTTGYLQKAYTAKEAAEKAKPVKSPPLQAP